MIISLTTPVRKRFSKSAFPVPPRATAIPESGRFTAQESTPHLREPHRNRAPRRRPLTHLRWLFRSFPTARVVPYVLESTNEALLVTPNEQIVQTPRLSAGTTTARYTHNRYRHCYKLENFAGFVTLQVMVIDYALERAEGDCVGVKYAWKRTKTWTREKNPEKRRLPRWSVSPCGTVVD